MLIFVDYLIRLVGFDGGQANIGLLVFNTNVKIGFHLNEHRTSEALTKAIMATTYTPGKTNMAEALHVMRTQMFLRNRGDRPGVPNIAVMITDGFSTLNQEVTIPEAVKANEGGVQIFCVGIGIRDLDELSLIARHQSRVFVAHDFDHLRGIAKTLRASICKGKSHIIVNLSLNKFVILTYLESKDILSASKTHLKCVSLLFYFILYELFT